MATKKKRRMRPGKVPADALEAIRTAAKAVYVSNFRTITLNAMRDLPAFSRVSLKQLREWSVQDNWLESRERNYRAFRRTIEKQARAQWVATGHNQMRDCEEISRQSMEMLRDNALQPKSWEAVAQIKLAVLKMQQDLVTQFSGRLVDEVQHSDSSPFPDEVAQLASQRMTDEEALQVAHEVLLRRCLPAQQETATPAADTVVVDANSAENQNDVQK